MPTLSEIEHAIDQAEADLRRTDMVATSLARLLVGRLRRVNSQTALVELKRELQKYNIQTGRWRE